MVDMSETIKTDVILIGAGIMSATLGTLLHELEPDWKITLFEKLDKAGEESSNEWNNAGTGHSALCELNYSVEQKDGSIDITKARRINEQFQITRQFWSYLIENGKLDNPQEFIMPIPHMSLVEGEKNVAFLRKRYAALKDNPLFADMEYTEDPEVLKEWVPLMMEGRTSTDPIAAHKTMAGTDVNFGSLSKKLVAYLHQAGVDVQFNALVKNIARGSDGRWEVTVQKGMGSKTYAAKFVFIGAGGAALPLLQKSGIPEAKGIGGFPISGIFMVCKNPDIVKKHQAKVYSKAKVGAPPMSVPHLDTRYIDGQQCLLYGPFAGFSPKFLKTGSMLDLILAIKPDNLLNYICCGLKEFGLEKYLVQQLLLNDRQRLEDLRIFVPTAKAEDWELLVAGQRVQVISEEQGKHGVLKFGTETIVAADGTIAAVLGASPGASIAPDALIKLLARCFPGKQEEWRQKIKAMVPTYGISLEEHPDLLKETQARTAKILQLPL